jgi:hypothetical protein
MKGFEHRFHKPKTWKNLFDKWCYLYKGSLKRKHTLKCLWATFPKYICWKVWLARNRAIFQQESTKPELVANKAITLLAEFINVKGFHHYEFQMLEQDEVKWSGTIQYYLYF